MSDECPFCGLVAGSETEVNSRADVVHEDSSTTAFVSPKWWKTNPGHVIVVPNEHVENVYSISEDTLAAVYATAKRVAVALKDVYRCDGTSMRQHNEAGGGQDVWHFHVHVFPRYAGDRLYENDSRTRWAAPEERAAAAERLRAALGAHP